MKSFLDVSIESFNNTIQPHSHNVWEIIYFMEGEGLTYLNNQPYKFSPGSIICQPPRVIHYRTLENSHKIIRLVLSHMDDFVLKTPFYHDNYSGDFKQILLQMINYSYIKERNWENILNAQINLLKEYMISWNLPKKNSYIDMCEKKIIENLSNRDFSLKDLIHTIPVSATYFMKQFKKETGYTPNQYLTVKRVDYAKSLLINLRISGLLIKDVAAMTGFRNQCYFSRVFKKITDVSPENIVYP